jgi:hypothetical protein
MEQRRAFYDIESVIRIHVFTRVLARLNDDVHWETEIKPFRLYLWRRIAVRPVHSIDCGFSDAQ